MKKLKSTLTIGQFLWLWLTYMSVFDFIILGVTAVSSVAESGTTKLPTLNETSIEPIGVRNGEEALIDCVVKNLGNYTLIWNYAVPGREVTLAAGDNRITSDKRFSVIHESGSSTWILSIKNVSENDAGVYSCEINSVPKVRMDRILHLTDIGEINWSKIEHNYTDCCIDEGVPNTCHSFCRFRDLVQNEQPSHITRSCYKQIPKIAKCLTDGRDHKPCCYKQNIPPLCVSICEGSFTLESLTDHFLCMKYAGAMLACIAEGIQTLPPQVRDITVEPLSPTELEVTWQSPRDNKSAQLIETIEIRMIQLHSFDDDGILREETENSTALSPPSNYGLQMSSRINASVGKFHANNLEPFTIYEITLISRNKHGQSVPTQAMRVLTMNPKNFNQTEQIERNEGKAPQLPNVKKCCQDNGLRSGRCVDILCDPVRIDQTSIADMIQCATYSNITFKCLTSRIDHSQCCRERGVIGDCLHFCSGSVDQIDFRDFRCLRYMTSFQSCLLEFHAVLPTEPRNFSISTVHQTWALLKWSPPLYLPHTVIEYHVHYRVMASDEINEYSVQIANKTPYLLDTLKPNTQYEVYVTAVNQYGLSRESIRINFVTEPDAIDEQPDITVNYNETQCCVSSGMKGDCLKLCSYRMKVSDILHYGPRCIDQIQTLIRCGAGGRNHIACCRRRQVQQGCLNLCAGLVDMTPLAVASRCSDDLGAILQCMEEGSTLLPPMPKDFHAVFVNKTVIHVKWSMSDSGANTVSGGQVNREQRNGNKNDDKSDNDYSEIEYQIHYGRTRPNQPLPPRSHTSSKAVKNGKMEAIIDGLEPNATYSMFVFAMSKYGMSLPSLVLLINTSDDSSASESRIHSTIGPPHGIEILLQTIDSLTFKWLPPIFTLPDRQISYIVYYRANNGTEVNILPGINEKWIRVPTNYNSMIITNLTYNTEYAIAVQSVTDKNETSQLSEMVLVWTDPPIPASVKLPVIMPAGDIVENSNITVLCIAMGTPTPMVSMFINGLLVRRDQRRHISWTLFMIQRNISIVTCYATNGFGADAQSAQSSAEIRVRFKPTIKPNEPIARASINDSTKMQCEISGNPQPKVFWYRDLKTQVQIEKSKDISFITVPHLTQRSTWISTMLLNNIQLNQEGHYLCVAENDHGRATSSIELRVEETKTVTSSMNCCQEQNVTSECLRVCDGEVDIGLALNIRHCHDQFDKLMFCASDGRDHRKCCQERNVDKHCIRWCAGMRIQHSSNLCLIQSAAAITSCFGDGKMLLPTRPRDVHITKVLNSRSALIEWKPPSKNSDLIQYYLVFWRTIGTKHLMRNRTKETHYILDNLDSNKIYEFVVKAGTHHGESVFTDPLVISINDMLHTSSSRIGSVVLRIFIGISLTIICFTVIAVLYTYRRHYLPRRSTSSSGISFENPSYLKDTNTVNIGGVEPNSIQLQHNNNAVNGGETVKS